METAKVSFINHVNKINTKLANASGTLDLQHGVPYVSNGMTYKAYSASGQPDKLGKIVNVDQNSPLLGSNLQVQYSPEGKVADLKISGKDGEPLQCRPQDAHTFADLMGIINKVLLVHPQKDLGIKADKIAEKVTA